MAHCPYELLQDIGGELDKIRALAGVTERKPGIFYIKSDGFLHFHIKGEERWADVKPLPRGKWLGIPLPFKPSASKRAAFLKAVAEAHRSYTGLKSGRKSV